VLGGGGGEVEVVIHAVVGEERSQLGMLHPLKHPIHPLPHLPHTTTQ